jgi:hypothetical protein
MQTSSTRQRLERWAWRGALILAGLSAFFGSLFTALIGSFTGDLAADADWAARIQFVGSAALVWFLGGLPFGAVLGSFASLIWSDQPRPKR